MSVFVDFNNRIEYLMFERGKFVITTYKKNFRLFTLFCNLLGLFLQFLLPI